MVDSGHGQLSGHPAAQHHSKLSPQRGPCLLGGWSSGKVRPCACIAFNSNCFFLLRLFFLSLFLHFPSSACMHHQPRWRLPLLYPGHDAATSSPVCVSLAGSGAPSRFSSSANIQIMKIRSGQFCSLIDNFNFFALHICVFMLLVI